MGRVGFTRPKQKEDLTVVREVEKGKGAQEEEILQELSDNMSVSEMKILLKVVTNPELKQMALSFAENI